MRNSDTFNVIIIGSDPAGFTAAIYVSRTSVETLFVTGSLWGGQLMLTAEVENFPGFADGVLGLPPWRTCKCRPDA